jgi:hypothetical protein
VDREIKIQWTKEDLGECLTVVLGFGHRRRGAALETVGDDVLRLPGAGEEVDDARLVTVISSA